MCFFDFKILDAQQIKYDTFFTDIRYSFFRDYIAHPTWQSHKSVNYKEKVMYDRSYIFTGIMIRAVVNFLMYNLGLPLYKSSTFISASF